MKEGFRQSMAWLHTWSGLLVCWILFLVFIAGTAAYYRDEMSLWMKPELQTASGAPVTQAQAAQNAVRALQQVAPDAKRWLIQLPDERVPTMRIAWLPSAAPGEKAPRFRDAILDPSTGATMPAVRETYGGDFPFRLHYDLYYLPPRVGPWIVGFCAMFMLVAIISGVITHRRIFKDFFTFRPKKGQRSWLDAHNAVGVLALPYHLMITYTGLVTLMFFYMPSGVQAAYKGDQKMFIAEVFPSVREGTASGTPAAMAPIDSMLAQAERHWQGNAHRIVINHPGDANATVAITHRYENRLSYLQPAMQFHGVTGALLSTHGDVPSAAAETRGVLFGLHLAHFADPLLRSLFFLCGLAGCAMVATGALLWAVKRRQNYAKTLANGGRVGFGLRLVDGMNIGVIAGLPIAFAIYFWANRLLPVGMANRADIEVRCFFIAWAVALMLAHLRPNRRMWQWQLACGGILFMALPVLSMLTSDVHLGVTLLHGPFVFVGFEAMMLMLGAALLFAAWKLRNGVARPEKKTAQEDAGMARNDSIPEAP